MIKLPTANQNLLNIIKGDNTATPAEIDEIINSYDFIINLVDANNESLLIHAAKNKKYIIVKKLIECDNININAVDRFNTTALGICALNNSIDIVKLLLEHKNIDVNLCCNRFYTPLIAAAFKENVEILELLLKFNNIEIHETNQESISAFKYAVLYKNSTMLTLIKQHKCF